MRMELTDAVNFQFKASAWGPRGDAPVLSHKRDVKSVLSHVEIIALFARFSIKAFLRRGPGTGQLANAPPAKQRQVATAQP